ncbi:hypothetical protein TYRP_022085, partial [Tyrophagus putrescentiae]
MLVRVIVWGVPSARRLGGLAIMLGYCWGVPLGSAAFGGPRAVMLVKQRLTLESLGSPKTPADSDLARSAREGPRRRAFLVSQVTPDLAVFICAPLTYIHGYCWGVPLGSAAFGGLAVMLGLSRARFAHSYLNYALTYALTYFFSKSKIWVKLNQLSNDSPWSHLAHQKRPPTRTSLAPLARPSSAGVFGEPSDSRPRRFYLCTANIHSCLGRRLTLT